MDSLYKKLSEPFPLEDLEFKPASIGTTKEGKPWVQVLTYVAARAIMNRLDDVVGMENWKNEVFHSDKGVMCRLSVRINGEWISKEDGAEYTDFEAYKGGISGSLKRAAVLFGIGRYLYDLESSFGKIVEKGAPGARSAKTKEGVYFYWAPPTMPAWSLPQKKVAGTAEKVAPKKTAFDIANIAIRVGSPTGVIFGKTYSELERSVCIEVIKKIKAKQPVTPDYQEVIDNMMLYHNIEEGEV